MIYRKRIPWLILVLPHQHVNPIKLIINLLTALGALATLALMIYAGRGWKSGVLWWTGFVMFGACTLK